MLSQEQSKKQFEEQADEQSVTLSEFQIQELSGQGFTYRHDWGDWKGQVILTLNWGVVNRNSRVFVSASEGFMGGARYTVHNVAPFDGGVVIRVNIEHGEPIRLYVSYLVVN